MCFYVDETRMDLGNALGFVRGFRLSHQRLALLVSGEHEVDEAFGAGGGFLLDAADARAFGNDGDAALGRELAADNPEERGLTGAVAPNEPDMRARGQRRGGVVDQEALAKAICEGADMQHRGLFARLARSGKIECARRHGPIAQVLALFAQAGNSASICLTLSVNAFAAGECVRPRFEMKP